MTSSTPDFTERSADRFARRASSVRRRPWWRAVVAAVVLAALVFGLWVVYASPWLAVQTVAVRGVPVQERARYAALADVPLGTPLVRLDTQGIVRRVTSEKVIANASVQKSYPSTVIVHLEKRTPVLALRSADGKVTLVDGEGVAFQQVAAAPKGVPVAVAPSDRALSPEATQAAVAAMSALPRDLGRSVSALTVESASRVTFRLGRTLVVWGGKDRPGEKARLVEILVKEDPRPGTIDVSAPDSPVTR
ncbi:MAG: cell division protein FtsQ/DivIB [Micrococcales bacterium]|nr:cell division protein FtsQ/DivIB [Micrococcales bacterium]